MKARTERRAARRARVISSASLVDPARFAEEVFGLTVWSKQRDVLRAARDHDRVSVRSGHKVSKSTSAAVLAWWYTADPVHRPAARAIITAPTGRQVSEIIWREILALHARAKQRDFALPVPGGRPGTGVRWGDGREIVGFTIDDGQPEAIAGFSGANLLFILDEASGINDRVFEALDGNAAAGARFFLISNPTRTSGAFFESHQLGSDYFALHISSEASPNVTGEARIPGLATREWVERMVAKYGRDSLFVAVRVRGEFPASADDEIFGAALVRSAAERDVPAEGPGVAGLDVAAFGGDTNVLAFRRGRRVLPLIRLDAGDSAAVAGQALRALRRLRASGEIVPVYIDANGVGFGVWSLLAGDGFEWDDEHFVPRDEVVAVAVMASEAATDPTYANRRAEMHFHLREQLALDLALPQDRVLDEELRALKYQLDPQGRILAMPKKKLRALLERSPDAADAVMLAALDPPAPREIPAPPPHIDAGDRTAGFC